jgi:hypothetical protein
VEKQCTSDRHGCVGVTLYGCLNMHMSVCMRMCMSRQKDNNTHRDTYTQKRNKTNKKAHKQSKHYE